MLHSPVVYRRSSSGSVETHREFSRCPVPYSEEPRESLSAVCRKGETLPKPGKSMIKSLYVVADFPNVIQRNPGLLVNFEQEEVRKG